MQGEGNVSWYTVPLARVIPFHAKLWGTSKKGMRSINLFVVVVVVVVVVVLRILRAGPVTHSLANTSSFCGWAFRGKW